MPRTRGSKSHSTPGSESHTTPRSQSHNTRGTPGSHSHNTRSTTGRSSHRTTPGTSRAGRIQKNMCTNRTRRQLSLSLEHNPALTEINSSSSQSGEDEASEYRSTPPNNSPHDTSHQQKYYLRLMHRCCVLPSATSFLRPVRPDRPELRCKLLGVLSCLATLHCIPTRLHPTSTSG